MSPPAAASLPLTVAAVLLPAKPTRLIDAVLLAPIPRNHRITKTRTTDSYSYMTLTHCMLLGMFAKICGIAQDMGSKVLGWEISHKTV